MCSTPCSTIYMGTKIIKKLEFKNPDIFKHQSDFTGKEGIQLKRVYTSFKMKKTTAFRGLCLCEYLKGEKHFVIRFTLRGQRKKKRIFSLGKFDNNLDVVTGETKFGVKQCQERLLKNTKTSMENGKKILTRP